MSRCFAICVAGFIVVTGAVALRSEDRRDAAEKEIASVEAEINRTEAETLARVEQGSLDQSQQVVLLGKLLFYDQELSVRRNEACAFCHMPEAGFSGPVSTLNQTTVSYPGSIR